MKDYNDMEKITDLRTLYQALEHHDWFYEMSDDHRVYTRGRDDWDRINRSSRLIGGGEELVKQYTAHVWSRAHEGETSPKPERP